VKHGKYVSINGSDNPRLQPVISEPSVITLGIDNVQGADRIRSILESVQTFEIDFDMMIQ
jgi:hypothetical protein